MSFPEPEVEPVGTAMECSNRRATGMTIATFNEDRVPVGSKLYSEAQYKALQKELDNLITLMKSEGWSFE